MWFFLSFLDQFLPSLIYIQEPTASWQNLPIETRIRDLAIYHSSHLSLFIRVKQKSGLWSSWAQGCSRTEKGYHWVCSEATFTALGGEMTKVLVSSMALYKETRQLIKGSYWLPEGKKTTERKVVDSREQRKEEPQRHQRKYVEVGPAQSETVCSQSVQKLCNH